MVASREQEIEKVKDLRNKLNIKKKLKKEKKKKKKTPCILRSQINKLCRTMLSFICIKSIVTETKCNK